MVGDHDHVTAGDQKLDRRLRSRRAGGDRAHLHIVGEDRALEAKVRPEQGHRGRRQVSGTLRIQGGKEEMAEQHEISSVSDGGRSRALTVARLSSMRGSWVSDVTAVFPWPGKCLAAESMWAAWIPSTTGPMLVATAPVSVP